MNVKVEIIVFLPLAPNREGQQLESAHVIIILSAFSDLLCGPPFHCDVQKVETSLQHTVRRGVFHF